MSRVVLFSYSYELWNRSVSFTPSVAMKQFITRHLATCGAKAKNVFFSERKDGI